jgi:putative aminopeptidase FrvX
MSGADMASRAGCAAVAAASGTAPIRGETIYVLSAQSSFGWTGLSAVLARIGAVDSLVIVDPDLARSDSGAANEAVIRREVRVPFRLPERPASSRVATIAVRARFPGTLVESVSMADLDTLAAAVRSAAGVASPDRDPRLPLADRVVYIGSKRRIRDSSSTVEELLGRLTDVYAVSEHEGRMRDAVLAELPGWARGRVQTDSAGNLVLAMGPDRDTTVFVAHLDEIGFEITRIAADGVVSLRTRGGFYSSLWEGQPALLHYESDAEGARLRQAARCPLRGATGIAGWVAGVFLPRDSAPATKQPAETRAWFGTDSAGLVACGVRAGMALTGVKHSTRLLGTRFTARSIDDRAGCAALIMALRDIDPARLTRKVIFAWSVREETALGGAAAMAATFGPAVRRVYAVDTFVSSDSPLESSRFAHTPIGAGAVVRALDNSSATPPGEVERVVRLARAAGIPLQVGTTNGGNDGSELARVGAVDIPISWPLRYSHSPAEVIDLVDVRSLARLVAALARQ